MSDFVSPPPPPSMPPPPVMPGAAAAKPGPIGWVAVAAGVLGVLGLVLPWYSPKLSKPVEGVTGHIASYHAWSGFVFLVAAPVLLIVFSVLWFQALRGKPNSRFAGMPNPTRSLATQSLVAGAIALALALVSFVLMKRHYKNWDLVAKEIKTLGATLEKNPQPGLYAVLLGAVLLIAAGAAAVFMPGSPAAPGTAPVAAPGAAPAQDGFGAAPGYYPPVNPPQS